MNREKFLLEISQELGRFDRRLLGLFRCPTCLKDFPIDNHDGTKKNKSITEEHIIPDSVGGKQTTFLCKDCNSTFGHKQTKWLADWIELNEGGAPFHLDPKKQKAKITTNGTTLNGNMHLAEDGAIEFYSDPKRTNPKHLEAYLNSPRPSQLEINYSMPVFDNEHSLEVGFLTAAYGLWFKHFGYSFILQSCMDIVREQILNPNEIRMKWKFVLPSPSREIEKPQLGLMRFDREYYPFALIYDCIVIMPSAKKMHPPNTPPEKISKKIISLLENVNPRFQHRCVGPAVLICDHQTIVEPDMIATTTVPSQYIWMDGWP